MANRGGSGRCVMLEEGTSAGRSTQVQRRKLWSFMTGKAERGTEYSGCMYHQVRSIQVTRTVRCGTRAVVASRASLFPSLPPSLIPVIHGRSKEDEDAALSLQLSAPGWYLPKYFVVPFIVCAAACVMELLGRQVRSLSYLLVPSAEAARKDFHARIYGFPI